MTTRRRGQSNCVRGDSHSSWKASGRMITRRHRRSGQTALDRPLGRREREPPRDLVAEAGKGDEHEALHALRARRPRRRARAFRAPSTARRSSFSPASARPIAVAVVTTVVTPRTAAAEARGIAQVPAHDLGLEPGRRIAAHQHTQRQRRRRRAAARHDRRALPRHHRRAPRAKPTRDVTVSPRHVHGRSPPVGYRARSSGTRWARDERRSAAVSRAPGRPRDARRPRLAIPPRRRPAATRPCSTGR